MLVAEQSSGPRALQVSEAGAEVPPGPVTVKVHVVEPSLAVDRPRLLLAPRLAADELLAPLHTRLAAVAPLEVQLTVMPSPISTDEAERLKLVMRGTSTHEPMGLVHWPPALHSIVSAPVKLSVLVLRTEAVAPPPVAGRLKVHDPVLSVV